MVSCLRFHEVHGVTNLSSSFSEFSDWISEGVFLRDFILLFLFVSERTCLEGVLTDSSSDTLIGLASFDLSEKQNCVINLIIMHNYEDFNVLSLVIKI